MIIALLLVVFVWAFGWGYWCNDASNPEMAVSFLWPILVPTGKAYHRWRWGSNAKRRYVYTNTRWWQRGDAARRSPDWNKK